MNTPLTVILPCFNSEGFVNKCINNLKNQTFSNFYCIFIDDGSTDNSYNNAVKAINNDSRFCIIKNQKNMGIGYTRVKGIKLADTEYITFIDIDDELSPDAIAKIVSNCAVKKADLYIYDYFEKNDMGKIKLQTDSSVNFESLFNNSSILIPHLWHKVFKRSLFNEFDTSFLNEISFAEDFWLCINCFLISKNIEIIHDAYYFYNYTPTSLIHTRSEKSCLDNIMVLKNLADNAELKNIIPLKNYIEKERFHTFGLLIFPNPRNKKQSQPHFSEWLKLDEENPVSIPVYISSFVRLYIKLIRKRAFFTASLLWKILYLKQFIAFQKR